MLCNADVVPERWREEMGPAAVITDDLLHNTDSYHENGKLIKNFTVQFF